MYSDAVIKVKNLSKIYKLYDKPIDRLKEVFHPFKKQYHRDFYALQNIFFDVRPGEILGLVGKNGSGKSTVLQIISGVLTPSSGSVNVQGMISALLELGAGFNPELTGLENVYFKSSLMGNSRAETDENLDEILDFADIGDFVYQPVKTYSSGMFVRLAFAVAVNVDPQILIVDEALSVGDFRFRQKCLRRIKKFREVGKTILFVSHDTGAVTEFCTRAIWLRDGEVFMDGIPRDVCKEYISFMSFGEVSKETQNNKPEVINQYSSLVQKKSAQRPWVDISSCSSFGKKACLIRRMAFYRQGDFQRIDSFSGGERVVLSLEIEVLMSIERPVVGFVLVDTKGIHILGTNSQALGYDWGGFVEGEFKIVDFEFDFPLLKTGDYSFSPAVAERDLDDVIEQHHWVHDAYLLRIVNSDLAAHLGYYLVIKDNFDIRIL